MRILIAAMALALAACDRADTESKAGGETPAAQGYTMEIRASAAEQTYLILAPDGRIVGARASEGASALMQSSRAQSLAAEPPPDGEELPEVMSLRVPGFEMSMSAGADTSDGEPGRISMSIGDGGEHVEVRADEGGPGEADDRAYVRISGADEDAVRAFIAEQGDLSPEVRADMLRALGLQPR